MRILYSPANKVSPRRTRVKQNIYPPISIQVIYNPHHCRRFILQFLYQFITLINGFRHLVADLSRDKGFTRSFIYDYGFLFLRCPDAFSYIANNLYPAWLWRLPFQYRFGYARKPSLNKIIISFLSL